MSNAGESCAEPGPGWRRFRDALRCPQCRGELEEHAQSLLCARCGVHYPVRQGRPELITAECRAELEAPLRSAEGKRMRGEYASAPASAASRASWLSLLRPPAVMYRYHPDLRQPPTSVLFEENGVSKRLVLNVGGGPYRVSAEEITLNIGPYPGVDLIADAHLIPLADESMDSVFSLAVLEHVANPYRVVNEMIRVLRPGGVLYSEVPFIFFFHGYPTDYTRFTREGMRRLFRRLDPLEIGMTHGPVSAVLQSANMVLDLLLARRSRLVRKAANGAFRWLLFPLKYLDIPLRSHPDAHTVAGGFYVLGRKPARS